MRTCTTCAEALSVHADTKRHQNTNQEKNQNITLQFFKCVYAAIVLMHFLISQSHGRLYRLLDKWRAHAARLASCVILARAGVCVYVCVCVGGSICVCVCVCVRACVVCLRDPVDWVGCIPECRLPGTTVARCKRTPATTPVALRHPYPPCQFQYSCHAVPVLPFLRGNSHTGGNIWWLGAKRAAYSIRFNVLQIILYVLEAPKNSRT